MAQVTVPIATFAEGLAVVSIRYNDQTLVINRVETVNDSGFPVHIIASKPGYPTQEHTVDAHSSTQQKVANLQFQSVLDEGDDADGNPLGYNITLGDIQLGVRWPA
jgi:hypothetical protein